MSDEEQIRRLHEDTRRLNDAAALITEVREHLRVAHDDGRTAGPLPPDLLTRVHVYLGEADTVGVQALPNAAKHREAAAALRRTLQSYITYN